MIGDLQQLAELTAVVKGYLKQKVLEDCVSWQNISTITFIGVCDASLTGEDVEIIRSIQGWVNFLLSKGLVDISLYLDFNVKAQKVLCFSRDKRQKGILCTYEDGSKSVWLGKWMFNDYSNSWNVYYKEILVDIHPQRYPDNPEKAFFTVLEKGERLCRILQLEEMGIVFQQSMDILSNRLVLLKGGQTLWLPGVYNEERLRIYLAAVNLCTFMGMTAKGASPSVKAFSSGLVSEYEAMRKELFDLLVQAFLYAINMP